MKPKFEIGDQIRHTITGFIGTIVEVDTGSADGYYVVYNYDDTDTYYVHESDIEFENPKVIFLTRLQELLATFDATIYDYEQYRLCIDLGDGEQMGWSWDDKPMNQCRLGADNVFDYKNK